MPESPVRAGRHRGTSVPAVSPPGGLVVLAGYRSRAGVTRERWSTLRVLRHECESSRTAGRTPRPTTRARVAQECWSSPEDLGTGHESPGLGGRHRGLRDTGPSGPGMLVDTAGPGTWSRVARDSWLTPRALGTRPESPGSACRTHGLSEPGSSPPGQLVDTAGPRTRARVARECTSTVQDLGPRPESPGAAG